jgi:catechol 2,3-dioxygenase-like lactoylglutathione lyase family enzyme
LRGQKGRALPGYPSLMSELTAHRYIDHVTMNVTDAGVARSFYDATLAELGLTASVDSFGRVEYVKEGHGEFGFYAGPARAFFEKPHVAFAAPDRAAVDAFFRTALDRGGVSIDSPRARPEFGYYSAYLQDPDGHVIEIGIRL